MKVLYCNPSFWEYRLPFYEALNKLFDGNFHVIYSTKRFVRGHERLLEDIKERLGDNAHPYDSELMYDVHTHSFSQYSEEYKHIPLPLGLWKMINQVCPDVLITEGFFQWTPWVQMWAFIHHVPIFVGYERTLHTERNNGKLKTWIRKVQDKLIKGYFVNGIETRKYLESIGISKGKIHEVGMSADSKGLQKDVAVFRKSSGYLAFKHKFWHGGLVYLFTGKLIERKGVIPMLNAWKQHIKEYPNDSLILVGDGYLMKECKKLVENNKTIFLEGRVDYSKVHQYYAIADVYFLPTIEDNWSLVIPEAMSCELPVATSIYNGCHPELIHEGENGVTFDTFNHEELVRAFGYFHNHDLKEMGLKSMEFEKPFNTESCACREYKIIFALVRKE